MFLRFLCETLHPVVRTDPEEIERLRQGYNLLLSNDGYEIVPKAKMWVDEQYMQHVKSRYQRNYM